MYEIKYKNTDGEVNRFYTKNFSGVIDVISVLCSSSFPCYNSSIVCSLLQNAKIVTEKNFKHADGTDYNVPVNSLDTVVAFTYQDIDQCIKALEDCTPIFNEHLKLMLDHEKRIYT